MEADSVIEDDVKCTFRCNYSKSSSSPEGSSPNNGLQLDDIQKDHSKNHDLDRSQEVRNRDRTFYGMDRHNFEEESRDLQNVQQPALFPPSTCNTTDHAYVDNNRRAMSVKHHNSLATMPINHSSASKLINRGIEMAQTFAMNPSSYIGMPGGNVFRMMGMENYYPYGQENGMVDTVKEVVHLTQCVLYPPEPTYTIFTRARPPKCKTVFVGNLPKKITEEIIREVFERCGEILKIRMMHLQCKSFCYVEFTSEEFVDRALHFSGYEMKIGNKDEQPYTGRLHVNYAVPRDDTFESKQRGIQHEARHRQQQEEECQIVTTLPPVVHYSEHEATILGEKLQSEESFQQAVFILITWLEKGECNKQNAGLFFSMIHSANSHVKRLMNEKLKYKDQLNKARSMLKNETQGIFLQCDEIEKVFNAVSLLSVWNHFTKNQRKNIESWKKQTEELKNVYVEEVLNDGIEDESYLSKDEDVAKETPRISDQKNELKKDINKLKDDNDVLRCQLSAAENEIMILRSNVAQALKSKECHIQGLMQVLTNTTNALNQKRASDETQLQELHTFKSKRIMDKDDQDGNNAQSEIDNIGPFNTTSFAMCISETDARLLGLISTFLNVHPFGANIDYICSYLHQIDSSIQSRDIENLMKRFPTVYQEEFIGNDASLGRKWRFIGFQ